jgi:tRNA pseudouridine55 synthase
MGRRRNSGRNVHGILLLDKPLGLSSNKALQKVKTLFKAQKAGHTGSLDPLADGLLPLCFGNATKMSAFLLDADKHYWVKVKLGEKTTTGDAEGDVIETRSTDGITEQQLEEVLDNFHGEISQLPPMYSAVKHKGERLYKLARQGIEVERKPRNITIHSIDLTHFELPEFEMLVHCSKGTYVRTLAEDIGEVLGCGAYVSSLRRTGVCPFTTENMVTMYQLEAFAEAGLSELDGLLLGVDSAVTDWPRVDLNANATFYISQGQPLQVAKAPADGWVRLYDNNGTFIGVGEIDDDGKVAPKRLFVSGNQK